MDKELRKKLREIQDKVEAELESLNFKQVEGSIDDRHLTSQNNRVQVFNCPALSQAIMVYKDFPTIGKPQVHENMIMYHKVAMARAVKGYGVKDILKRNFLKNFTKFIKEQIMETQDGED